MNQTRVFLLIAWLLVATLLWMEWNKEQTAALQTPPAATQTTSANGAVPGAVPSAPTATAAGIPAAPAQPGVPTTTAATAQTNNAVTVTTDTLRVTLDGGNVRNAELLKYPSEAKSTDAGNVTLFDADPARFYEAQSGWVSSTGAAPDHLAAVRARRQRAQRDARRRTERDRGSLHLDRRERRDHPPHVHLPARRLRHRRARRSASTTARRTGRAMSIASWCATRRRRRPATPIPKPSLSTAPPGTRRATSTSAASTKTSPTTARSTRTPPAAGSRCCSTTSSPRGSRATRTSRSSR